MQYVRKLSEKWLTLLMGNPALPLIADYDSTFYEGLVG